MGLRVSCGFPHDPERRCSSISVGSLQLVNGKNSPYQREQPGGDP